MVIGIDLNLLESLSNGDNFDRVQDIFDSLMLNIKEKLGFTPFETEIWISILKEEEIDFDTDDSFEFGINTIEDDRLKIQISSKYAKFIPQILVRECYKQFIIPANRESIQVQFGIYMIIESELETLNNNTEWKMFIRSHETFKRYFADRTDSLIKFFRLEDPETKETLIPYFFEMINSFDPKLDDENILKKLYIEFIERVDLFMQDDEILETIKVLKEIFFTVKNYKALLDYQNYFKDFKESGIIKTDLSLRKFTSNVRWLNKHSFFAPDYHLNWFTINMAIYIINIKFHPSCRWRNIKIFLQYLPFFLFSQLSAIGYAKDFFGYIIIPNSYLKNLTQSIEYFEDTGFFHEIKLYILETGQYYLNLNYYTKLTEMGKFLHSQRKGYRKDFELKFKTIYRKEVVLEKLSLLDFIILDRARMLSFSGFGFERRESTLKDLKSDLLKEISYQKNIIDQLRNVLERFSESPDRKIKFLNLMQNNKRYSFFTFVKYIEQIVDSIKLAIEILKKNPSITSNATFNDFIKKKGISMVLHENFNLDNRQVRDFLVRELIPLYFHDRYNFNEEYKAFKLFNEYLSICIGLQIYDLNSIKYLVEKEKLDLVFSVKEEKLDSIYKQSQLRTITSMEIENRLEYFSTSDPPIISPKMLDSMINVAYSTISMILVAKKTNRVLNFIEDISHSIPYYTYYELKEFRDKKKLIYCRFGIQGMDMREKYEFYSIIHNQLKDDLLIFARFIHPGFYATFTRKNFYDFIDGTFFYTPNLYSEFKKFIKDRFGNNLPPIKIQAPREPSNFWLKSTSLVSLFDDLNHKRMMEHRNFDLNQLDRLLDFNKKIEYYLLNTKEYQDLREKPFFTQFIHLIQIKPILQDFGLQKYYVYFQAADFNAIIPELLLINSFVSVKFNSTRFDTYNFLVKYIFPYHTPNKAYLNWQLFSKKNINEYCLFSVKKTHEVLDFSKNITPDGWGIEYNLFMQHVQRVLFDPSYNPYNPNIRILNYEKIQIDSYIAPSDPKFKDLLNIYKRKSNIKSFWGTKKGAKLEPIVLRLLKNKLIYPSLRLKNLKLRECLYFIIPNLNNEQVKILIKLFQFFNVVTINEIEGEFYLNSLEKLITFNNGLYIKLKFPEIEISPFLDLIFDVLDYLKIENFIFFSELFKSNKWLNKVFKGIDLEGNYNPLVNLKWNDFDKIYVNHKLFGENFTPQYPKLNTEEKK